MNRVSPFLAGLLFGLGLCLSGMTNPQKVLGFLDLAGSWDPSLVLVMVGAIAVAVIAFHIASRRATTFSGHAFQLPTSKKSMRASSAVRLFRIGWGLAGLCPGPAIVNLGYLNQRAALFVLAMAAGMALNAALTAAAPARPVEAALEDG